MPINKKSPAKKRTTTTAWQRLQKKKAAHCKGKTTAAEVRKAATAYIKDAVKKGNKTKTEAEKSAKAVLHRGCSVSSYIKGKKKTTAKKVKGALTIHHGVGKKIAARKSPARRRSAK